MMSMKIIFCSVLILTTSCMSEIDVKRVLDANGGSVSDSCTDKESLAPFADGDGTSGDPFLICSHSQFNEIGSNSSYWSQYFKLGRSLDLSSYTANSFNKISGTNCATSRFTGEIDGDSFTISNLTYSQSGTNKVALFPCFNGTLKNIIFDNITITGSDDIGLIGQLGYDDNSTTATITNVSIRNSSFTGNYKIGALAGVAYEASVSNLQISNSSVTNASAGVTDGGLVIGYCNQATTVSAANLSGTVTHVDYVGGVFGQAGSGCVASNIQGSVTINARSWVGGIIGINDAGTISSANLAVNITATGNEVGGAVGGAWWCGSATDFENIRISGSVSGNNYVGGVFGSLDSGAGCDSNKIGSTASIVVASLGAGGAIGRMNSGNTFSNSYAQGTINGASGGVKGGFAGYWNAGDITNSYATGAVANGILLGGFSGAYTSGTCTNCYYSDSSGLSYTDDGQASLETDADMRLSLTYTGWDFATIWEIVSGNYPSHR